MSQNPQEKTGQSSKDPIALKDFLENVPSGKEEMVQFEFIKNDEKGNLSLGRSAYQLPSKLPAFQMLVPDLMLYCDSSICNGSRLFESREFDNFYVSLGEFKFHGFVRFICKNCEETQKTYAIEGRTSEDAVYIDVIPGSGSQYRNTGSLFKFGENPPFGPPTPSLVNKLIGPERDLFFKGRRAENQGFGIAAFAYYRRVVESQKNRILDEIIRAVQKTTNSHELLADLEKAKQETQFSSAIEQIKHGFPESLKIESHNPLSLLHSALSHHLHDESDARCLEIATDIRTILFEFSQRLQMVLKDDSAVQDAVKRLSKSKENKFQI